MVRVFWFVFVYKIQKNRREIWFIWHKTSSRHTNTDMNKIRFINKKINLKSLHCPTFDLSLLAKKCGGNFLTGSKTWSSLEKPLYRRYFFTMFLECKKQHFCSIQLVESLFYLRQLGSTKWCETKNTKNWMLFLWLLYYPRLLFR